MQPNLHSIDKNDNTSLILRTNQGQPQDFFLRLTIIVLHFLYDTLKEQLTIWGFAGKAKRSV